ncbi:MAG: hypothetical protein IPI31_15525 [Bacteroidetes bacterium]|nr:hypothetical protein [Bacteroidota bacterium]
MQNDETMEIVILRQNNNDLLRQNQIKWTLFTQKNINLFILYAIAGTLILMGSGMSQNEGVNFWGPSSSFGLSLIFLSIFYFFQTYQNKAKFIARTKHYIDRFNSQKEGIEITITDSSVTYKDFETTSEMKWTFFSQYKVYKDYLFIISESGYLSSIIINKNEINPEKFSKLFAFVKNTLQERK